MEEIFNYSDYRKYLKDYHDQMKSVKSSFSYRTISAAAGINSSGFYPLIIQGKRDLTSATINKTVTALALPLLESQYFEKLVYFNQAKSLKEKNSFFDELVSIQKQRRSQKITENQFDLFSAWYHPAIRELVLSRHFDGNFRKLGKMLEPAISSKQARDSVKLLLKLDLLRFENGKYLPNAPVISAGPNIKIHNIFNYQVKMLKLAIEAFDRFGPDELLSNSSTTFRISKETYEIFKHKNRQHRKELLEIAEKDADANHIYQLNINLFPLSNPDFRGGTNA